MRKVAVDVLRVLKLARRPAGLMAPELGDTFQLNERTALRVLARLARDGWLWRTSEHRRRVEVFGESVRGRGGVVYRATARGRNVPIRGIAWSWSYRLRQQARFTRPRARPRMDDQGRW